MPWATQNLMNKRTEFAMKAMQTENFRALCREYGISPRVGYKWRDRFMAEGMGGMSEKSRRPHRCPEKMEEEVVCRIVRLKERHRHWGPLKLHEIYRRQHGQAPSVSSFKRILERCGLTEKRPARRKNAEVGRISSGRQAQACNEVWTVDFKGWWYDRDGKCEPLTICDEYSRYILEVRAVPDARTETVRGCFEELFARYGMPGAIRSDNGAPFASVGGLLGLSRLSAWWLANGIDLERGRPGCPQDNGRHERMHRNVARELQGVAYAERQSAFDTWRREFNEERPHQHLGMRMPAEVYEHSDRKWSSTPSELEYPGMEKRRVHRVGYISHWNQRIALSAALGGWDVGLKARDAENTEVYFGQLLLGIIDRQTAALLPITSA